MSSNKPKPDATEIDIPSFPQPDQPKATEETPTQEELPAFNEDLIRALRDTEHPNTEQSDPQMPTDEELETRQETPPIYTSTISLTETQEIITPYTSTQSKKGPFFPETAAYPQFNKPKPAPKSDEEINREEEKTLMSQGFLNIGYFAEEKEITKDTNILMIPQRFKKKQCAILLTITLPDNTERYLKLQSSNRGQFSLELIPIQPQISNESLDPEEYTFDEIGLSVTTSFNGINNPLAAQPTVQIKIIDSMRFKKITAKATPIE